MTKDREFSIEKDPKTKKTYVKIEIDENSDTSSKSGKNIMLGSSHGFIEKDGIKVSYNIIKERKK